MRVQSNQSVAKRAIAYLLTPALCAVMLMTTALAQEAPRDSGSLIKPPTIKPPTVRAQSSSGRASSSRRRRRARRTRARTAARRAAATRAAATPRQVKGVVVESADNMPGSTQPESSTGSRARPRAPISGGVLNGRALILPPPLYPATAKAANVEGTVVVRVLIDENGKITETEAVSGPQLLRKAAEDAAKEARFAPTQLSGMPVSVTGVITYKFVVPQ